MSIPTAQAKCYITADKRLVADGDPEAKFLFAMPGDTLDAKRSEGVENIGEFFDIDGEKPKSPKSAKSDTDASSKPKSPKSAK